MITTGSKFFYGLAAILAVSAVIYGYATGDVALFDFSSGQDFVEGLTTLVNGNTGPLTFGYEGGVGDILGYTLLMSGAGLSLFLGITTNVFRDADPDAAAVIAGADTAPQAVVPQPSYWPIVGAFGAALVVLGIVVSNVFFVAGLIVLGSVAIEWTMQTWAERATGDPEVNREIRKRAMLPLEVPIAGAMVLALVIVGYSRVFLTVSKENAVWAALAIAAVVFVVGAALAARDTIRRDIVAGLLAVAALATIGFGIAAAVNGEREIVHYGGEQAEEGGHAEEGDHGDDHDETESEEGAGVLVEENN